jgi:hypothetical protein
LAAEPFTSSLYPVTPLQTGHERLERDTLLNLAFLERLKIGRILSQSDPNRIVNHVGDGTISRSGAKTQSLGTSAEK